MAKTVILPAAIVFAVAASSHLLAALADAKRPLEGLYACKGTNPDGGTYEGRVEIAKKGDGYNLKWKVGESTYLGVALREGDVLSVAWGLPGGGGTVVGVVAYKINADGTLNGRWTVLGGDNKAQKESLRKIPDA